MAITRRYTVLNSVPRIRCSVRLAFSSSSAVSASSIGDRGLLVGGTAVDGFRRGDKAIAGLNVPI